MKLLSYAGYTFSTNGFSANLLDTFNRANFDVSAQIVPRQDADPLHVGNLPNPRIVETIFTYDGTGGLTYENAWSLLLGKLRPRTAPAGGRVLTAQRNDGTNVQANAVVTLPGGWDQDFDVSTLLVTFTVIDLTWKKTTEDTDGPTVFSAAGSRTFTVNGYDEVSPLLKVAWVTQRPSAVALIGWSYRRSIVFTNNTDQTITNAAWQLGPFDHAALVAAGKSQADGDDVVVFDDRGTKLRHAIVGANTKACFVWFPVEQVPAGTSRTYDVCYGNSAATHDLTKNGFPYTYAKSPSYDVTGDNGTATSGAVGSLTDTGKTWDTNRLVGATILIWDGTGIGQYRFVLTQTGANTLGVRRNFTTAPDATSKYVVVGGGFHGDGGTASAATSTSLTDASQAANAGEWIGATIETYNPTTGVYVTRGTVTANTPTVFTVSSWDNGTPAVNDTYRVYRRNGKQVWRVEQISRSNTNHRGRYRLSSGQTKPSNKYDASDGSPGAWSFAQYNPGQANFDFNQPRFTSKDIGGGDIDYFAVLNASVARKDGARLTEEGFANGLAYSSSLPILGTRENFAIKNPGAMCRAVFGARDQGGEDWSLYKEYSTAQASLLTIAVAYYDLTVYGTPLHLIAALTSDDDADVADTETGTANLQDASILEAYIDTRNVAVTDLATATEKSVYDLTLTLRRGGATEAAGDDVVVIGGDERHVFLGADEELWVGPIGETPLAYRIYEVEYTTATIAVDSFTAADGTVLSTYNANWVKHTASGAGDITIDNNRIHNTNSAVMHLYYRSDWAPTNADCDVAADVVMRSDNNLSWAGVAARIQTAADTCYFAIYTTASNAWQLWKVVAGTPTQLGGNAAQTLTVDQAYALRLVIRGPVIKVLVDGVVIIAQTDTAITAAGRAGVRMSEAATTTIGVHLDNVAAYQGGDQVVVRDLARQVQCFTVEKNTSGTPTRYPSADALPMAAGSTTYYASDADGNIGTVAVAVVTTPSYL